MSKERPILFSGPMVKAILEGCKTQTRRVITPQPIWREMQHAEGGGWDWKNGKVWTPDVLFRMCMPKFCPYGQPGDRLWVRETFCIESNFNIDSDYQPPFSDGRPVKWTESAEYGDYWQQCHYKVTDPMPELAYADSDDPACRWSPSIHMPRWASRITLEIVSVRVERVQDISEADAAAEGIGTALRAQLHGVADDQAIPLNGELRPRYRNAFVTLWDGLNGQRGYGWSINPWVWVVEFKRVEPTSGAHADAPAAEVRNV